MGKQISGNCVSTYYTCKKREQNRIGKKKREGGAAPARDPDQCTVPCSDGPNPRRRKGTLVCRAACRPDPDGLTQPARTSSSQPQAKRVQHSSKPAGRQAGRTHRARPCPNWTAGRMALCVRAQCTVGTELRGRLGSWAPPLARPGWRGWVWVAWAMVVADDE